MDFYEGIVGPSKSACIYAGAEIASAEASDKMAIDFSGSRIAYKDVNLSV